MSKLQPRRAIVTQSVRITPNMQRVHLSGEDLLTFPRSLQVRTLNLCST